MARIAGIDLPKDKRIEIALTYIYGIGQKTATKILNETGVNPYFFLLAIVFTGPLRVLALVFVL